MEFRKLQKRFKDLIKVSFKIDWICLRKRVFLFLRFDYFISVGGQGVVNSIIVSGSGQKNVWRIIKLFDYEKKIMKLVLGERVII